MKLRISASLDADAVEQISRLAHANGQTLTAQMRHLIMLGLSFDSVLEECKERADAYAKQASTCAERQIRTVPEPQLSKLKGQHWRILAGSLDRIKNEIIGGDQQQDKSAA